MAGLIDLARACDANTEEAHNILNSQQDAKCMFVNDCIAVEHIKTKNKYGGRKFTRCVHIASQYSSLHIVASLLMKGALTDLTDDNKDTPLHSACRSAIDASGKVELLIEHDPELIHKENKSHLTALHLAVKKKDPSLCDILLRAGADVGALSGQMLTPLHIACHFNSKQCVELLLKQPNIDLNIQDLNGDTSLHHCSSRGHLTIVTMLKSHPKCMPYLTNKKGFTADQDSPLNRTLLKESDKGSLASVKTCIQHGAVCIADELKETPILKACKSAKHALEKVRILHELEPKHLLMHSKAGLLPVHLAVLRKNLGLLEFFVTKGCINMETLRNRTPLSIAAYFNLDQTVDFLLSHEDCDVNAQDVDKNTAAHLAAIQNHDAILTAIQAHPKYKFTIMNKAGKTADDIKYDILGEIFKKMCLHAPVYMVIRMLLTGTRLTVDTKGNTDLHIACNSSLDALEKCEVILETDPKLINTKNDDKDAPLHIACRGKNPDLVRFLLKQANIDVNTQNAKEWSPLHECIVPNNIENAKALVSNEQTDLNMLGNGYTACHLAASFRRREIMTLIQPQPRFKCNTLNNGGETTAQMWSTYGTLTDLIQTKWQPNQSRQFHIHYRFWCSVVLIRGHLFCCAGDVHVLDLELQEVRRVAAGVMNRVWQVAELADSDLVAAARTGIYHLSFKGDKRLRVSAGWYNSVVCHNDRVYAGNHDASTIEIYAHSGDTWWGMRRIQLPMTNDFKRLWVNNYTIYVSSLKKHLVYVFDHEGSLLGQHGDHGDTGGAGQLKVPLICHGDEEGHVLMADRWNQRMQVLQADGQYALVDTPGLGYPEGAVFSPGRLYIMDEPSPSSTSCRIAVYLPNNLNL